MHPAADSDDERRYFRYAANRLAAFSNITWDLGDDISLYRDLAWSHKTGTYLYECRPLPSPGHAITRWTTHQDRTAEWFGFTSFQEWSRPQHGWMLRAARGAEEDRPDHPAGQRGVRLRGPLSQVGAELPGRRLGRRAAPHRLGHLHGRLLPDDRRDGPPRHRLLARHRRRLGQRPRRRQHGACSNGYGHIVDFFTSFDWWKTDPHDELVDNGASAWPSRARLYAVYLPRGGKVTVKLAAGKYQAHWFNPRTGETKPLPAAAGPSWTSPQSPDTHDWALLLRAE